MCAAEDSLGCEVLQKLQKEACGPLGREQDRLWVPGEEGEYVWEHPVKEEGDERVHCRGKERLEPEKCQES